MDFEQQTYTGPVDWNIPSPTATPTSTNFAHNAFQTPKTTNFPSHFQDAFTTPQMPSYTTPRQSEYATVTPMQGQPHMQPNQYYPTMQASAGAAQGQAMPPPHQVTFQRSPAAYGYSQPPQVHHAAAMSFDSSHMQTPPPTRGSSVKKLVPQDVAFGTPSTIASRRFMTPQQGYTSSQAVPATQAMQYPNLQFPPEVYQFGNLGPQSAPVFPQTQLLWGSPPMYKEQQQQQQQQQQQPSLDDPFAPVSVQPIPWSNAPLQSNVQATSFDTPAMGSFHHVQAMLRPASAGQYNTSHAPPQMPPMTSASVDPSLVYSSPIRPVLPSNASSARKVRPQGPEMARQDSPNSEDKHSDTFSSTDTTNGINAADQLRRSNPTGTNRPKISETLSRSSSALSVPRTASPLKRSRKPVPLGSISETKKPPPRPRNSIVLTVDESGRASAVSTRFVNTCSPTKDKAIRDRYPGLFDSDSSDEEASEDEKDDNTPSRTTSFTSLARTKSIRLDPPVENLEGLSLPRSGSAMSMKVTPSRAAIAAAASLRRGGSLRKPTNTGTTPNGRRVTSSSATSSIDTCPMDTSSPIGAATSRGPEDFSPGLPGWNPHTLDDHNRRWSLLSREQLQQFPHPQPSVSPTHPPHKELAWSMGMPRNVSAVTAASRKREDYR
ncbi:unnamed protein product [Zymoseptoria tritici ST99CH_1A5]|uniref:Uncharacterized protein n=1 Tax=Zymoseptoria tritici ST99CH_1A5 TaxID=1276529 RepID=A0A1Y6LD82_ZYMTR|nr:unnamed protein product [Zymoseptoria tritici ST99CH_1A5]